MAFQDTKTGFIDYRYYKPKFHYTKKIAIKFEVDQDQSMITFSCAICSDEDNFCRATARELTSKRMDAGDVFTCNYDRSLTIIDNIKKIAHDMCDVTNEFYGGGDHGRMIKQLNAAFEEVDIAKIIDDSLNFVDADFRNP